MITVDRSIVDTYTVALRTSMGNTSYAVMTHAVPDAVQGSTGQYPSPVAAVNCSTMDRLHERLSSCLCLYDPRFRVWGRGVWNDFLRRRRYQRCRHVDSWDSWGRLADGMIGTEVSATGTCQSKSPAYEITCGPARSWSSGVLDLWFEIARGTTTVS